MVRTLSENVRLAKKIGHQKHRCSALGLPKLKLYSSFVKYLAQLLSLFAVFVAMPCYLPANRVCYKIKDAHE